MQKLKDFQESFLESFQSPDKANIDITGAGDLGHYQAIMVYRKDYILRLTEFLGDRYEACWKVLGDDDFLQTVEDYIITHPSTYKSLSQYGKSFCKYIHHKYQEEFPFIGKLASFEWSFNEHFNSPPVGKIKDLNLEKKLISCFKLTNQAIYYLSDYDLVYILKNKSNSEVLEWKRIESPCIILKYKEGYQVHFESFPIEFLRFFKLIDKGLPLKAVIDKCGDLQIDEKSWAYFYEHFFKAYQY